MLDRIMGIVTLKPAAYRAVADDQSATGQAAAIVIVMSILAGVIGAAFVAVLAPSLPAGMATSPAGTLVRTILSAIVSWLIGSWVFAFVSTTFFGGKTNTGEMLRVFGFTQVFQILAIIPICGGIVALILSVIGAIIGIREASEFDTTKAVLTGIIGFIILVIVSFIITAALAVVGLA